MIPIRSGHFRINFLTIENFSIYTKCILSKNFIFHYLNILIIIYQIPQISIFYLFP